MELSQASVVEMLEVVVDDEGDYVVFEALFEED